MAKEPAKKQAKQRVTPRSYKEREVESRKRRAARRNARRLAREQGGSRSEARGDVVSLAKTSKKSAGKKRGKKTTPKKQVKQHAKTRKKHGIIHFLLFWPVSFVYYLTKNMHPLIKWPMRWVGAVMAMMAYVGCIIGAFYLFRVMPYDLEKVHEMPARTMVYARDGKTQLGNLHGDNRYLVKFEEVSPYFCQALIAREDVRFHYHFGIDPIGIFRATVQNIKRKRFAQGASTLSVQLAENTYFNPDSHKKKSTLELLDQKLMEMALAVRIEAKYTKDEIQQHYMNRIFWGHTIRGIEAASRVYFKKSAKDLTLSEAAMLAGIIRGPSAFSPFRNLKGATHERNVTLDRMVVAGFITEQEAEKAKSEPLRVTPKSARGTRATYVMDAVRRDLDRILEKENIKTGGLTVITTVDPTVQRSAEIALDRRLSEIEKKPAYHHQTRRQWLSIPPSRRKAPEYLQGACVVIENKTGAIIAIVGGRNANESIYNRAIQAKRPIGSLFKPFVFLTAVNHGLNTKSWVSDARIRPGEIRGAPRSWSPHNSDGKFGGMITVEDALVRSRNTASIRVGNYVGLQQVEQTAKDVGFIQGFPHTPSSYLGSWPATPWQVASAYTVFPNRGDWYRPYIIKEIRNADGVRVWPSGTSSGKLVISAADPGASWSISRVLQQVVERGTARIIRRLGYHSPCAGKTGTTDQYKDAWFAGYTNSLTCAVWVGLDHPKTIIKRGYGATLAAPIWVDVMKTAEEVGYKGGKFKLVPLRQVELCRISSKRATAGCRQSHTAYMALVPADILPRQKDYCPLHPYHAKPAKKSGFHWPFGHRSQ